MSLASPAYIEIIDFIAAGNTAAAVILTPAFSEGSARSIGIDRAADRGHDLSRGSSGPWGLSANHGQGSARRHIDLAE